MRHSWRKQLALACLFTTFLFNSGLADAKRMGGGRSVGKQSSNVSQQRQAQQPQPAAAPAQAATTTPPKRNWGGILGGAAAGLGLGMLLSHFGGAGMMNGLSNILMIAALAMLAIWLFRKFRKPSAAANSAPASYGSVQPGYAGASYGSAKADNTMGSNAFDSTPNAHARMATPTAPLAFPQSGIGGATAAQANWAVPSDFDTDAFLRHAKVYFVRLQAAWDAGNTDDIREFTSPEMFAEIYADLAARGKEINKTDVVTLEATLLGIEQNGNNYVASVRFSGTIREAANATPEAFNEVWNLTKSSTGGGWILAGIQQN